VDKLLWAVRFPNRLPHFEKTGTGPLPLTTSTVPQGSAAARTGSAGSSAGAWAVQAAGQQVRRRYTLRLPVRVRTVLSDTLVSRETGNVTAPTSLIAADRSASAAACVSISCLSPGASESR
jgi:hypothetical protein